MMNEFPEIDLDFGRAASLCLCMPHADCTQQTLATIEDDGEPTARVGYLVIPARPDAAGFSLVTFTTTDGRNVHIELSSALMTALAELIAPRILTRFNHLGASVN